MRKISEQGAISNHASLPEAIQSIINGSKAASEELRSRVSTQVVCWALFNRASGLSKKNISHGGKWEVVPQAGPAKVRLFAKSATQIKLAVKRAEFDLLVDHLEIERYKIRGIFKSILMQLGPHLRSEWCKEVIVEIGEANEE